MKRGTYFRNLLKVVNSEKDNINTAKENVIQEIERQKKFLRWKTMLPTRIIDEIIQTFFEFEKNIKSAKNKNDIVDICKSQLISLFIEQPVQIENNDRENFKTYMYKRRWFLQNDMLQVCNYRNMTFGKIRNIINSMIQKQKSKLKWLKLLPPTIIEKVDNFFEEAENTINSVKNGDINELKSAIELIFSDEFEYLKEKTNEQNYANVESSTNEDERYTNEDIDCYIKNLFWTISSDEDAYLSDRVKKSVSDRIMSRIYWNNWILNMMISSSLKNKIKIKLEELGRTCTQKWKTVREIKDEIRSNWMWWLEATSDNEKIWIDLIKVLWSNWKEVDKEEISKKVETRIAGIEGEKDETKRKNGENAGMPIPKKLKDEAISQLIKFKEMLNSKSYDEIENHFSSWIHKEKSVPWDKDHQIEEQQYNNLVSEIQWLITNVSEQIDSEAIIEINKQVELIKTKFDKKIVDSCTDQFNILDKIIIKYVKWKIDSLPDSSSITIEYREQIKELENLYENLTAQQRSQLWESYAKYHLTKNKFWELSQRDMVEKLHITLLEKDIAALPNPERITISHSEQIEKVFRKYEDLWLRLQNQIKFEYLQKLSDAKNALLVASITNFISSLPDNAENTIMCKELIHTVSERYNKLPKSIRKEIFNRQKLFDVQKNLLGQEIIDKIFSMADITKYKINELKLEITNEYRMKYLNLLNSWRNENVVYDIDNIDPSHVDLWKLLETIKSRINSYKLKIDIKDDKIYFINKTISYRWKLVDIKLLNPLEVQNDEWWNINEDDKITFFMIDDVDWGSNWGNTQIKWINNKYYISLKDRKEMLDKIDKYIQKCWVKIKWISSMDKFLVLTYFLKTLVNELIGIPNNTHLIYNEQDFLNYGNGWKILLDWKNRYIV